MQTIVVIWDQLGQEPLSFFTTQDQRFLGLNRVYINTWTEDPVEEANQALLTSLMYDDEGHCKQSLQDTFIRRFESCPAHHIRFTSEPSYRIIHPMSTQKAPYRMALYPPLDDESRQLSDARTYHKPRYSWDNYPWRTVGNGEFAEAVPTSNLP